MSSLCPPPPSMPTFPYSFSHSPLNLLPRCPADASPLGHSLEVPASVGAPLRRGSVHESWGAQASTTLAETGIYHTTVVHDSGLNTVYPAFHGERRHERVSHSRAGTVLFRPPTAVDAVMPAVATTTAELPVGTTPTTLFNTAGALFTKFPGEKPRSGREDARLTDANDAPRAPASVSGWHASSPLSTLPSSGSPQLTPSLRPCLHLPHPNLHGCDTPAADSESQSTSSLPSLHANAQHANGNTRSPTLLDQDGACHGFVSSSGVGVRLDANTNFISRNASTQDEQVYMSGRDYTHSRERPRTRPELSLTVPSPPPPPSPLPSVEEDLLPAFLSSRSTVLKVRVTV